jgi:hypothetical protein
MMMKFFLPPSFSFRQRTPRVLRAAIYDSNNNNNDTTTNNNSAATKMDMRNKSVARPEGTDGTDHSYRQKIVDRYKAAAKARSYLNGLVATAMVYHPLVLLSVFLPKKIVGNAVEYDIHNVPILATNGMQFLIVLLCAHASRQVPSKEKRVLSLSFVLILLGVLNVVFALMVRFREHPDVVDHKKVAWIGAMSIEKVMKKLIGAKRCEVLGVRANKMYPSLAQLEVFGEIMSVGIPVAIRGMAKALITHGIKNVKSK